MKNILFICVENSCRSQMAEAFAHMHGQDVVAAFSSGSKASGQVNEKAIKSMQELNYDLSKHRSKSLNGIPEIEYDTVITMGCGDNCPTVKAKNRQDWEIPDPKAFDEDAFRDIRILIENKVLTLLESFRPG